MVCIVWRDIHRASSVRPPLELLEVGLELLCSKTSMNWAQFYSVSGRIWKSQAEKKQDQAEKKQDETEPGRGE